MACDGNLDFQRSCTSSVSIGGESSSEFTTIKRNIAKAVDEATNYFACGLKISDTCRNVCRYFNTKRFQAAEAARALNNAVQACQDLGAVKRCLSDYQEKVKTGLANNNGIKGLSWVTKRVTRAVVKETHNPKLNQELASHYLKKGFPAVAGQLFKRAAEGKLQEASVNREKNEEDAAKVQEGLAALLLEEAADCYRQSWEPRHHKKAYTYLNAAAHYYTYPESKQRCLEKMIPMVKLLGNHFDDLKQSITQNQDKIKCLQKDLQDAYALIQAPQTKEDIKQQLIKLTSRIRTKIVYHQDEIARLTLENPLLQEERRDRTASLSTQWSDEDLPACE